MFPRLSPSHEEPKDVLGSAQEPGQHCQEPQVEGIGEPDKHLAQSLPEQIQYHQSAFQKHPSD